MPVASSTRVRRDRSPAPRRRPDDRGAAARDRARERRQAQADGTVALIRSSFAVVAPRAEEVARHFYATLFSTAPETRDLFPVNMEVQRSRLLRALVHVVQMVDRPDELVPFLEQLGRDHRKFGVLAEHYDAVGVALLGAVAHVRRAGLDARGREGLDRRLHHGRRRDADGGPGRARAGDLAGPGRRAPPGRLGPRDRRGRRERAHPVPGRAVRQRRDPAAPAAVALPLAGERAARRRAAGVPRPRGAGGLGQPRDRGALARRRHLADRAADGPAAASRRNNGRNVLLVAGGTGLAPIRALLEDLARGDGQPRTQVFIGGRTWDDLYDFAPLRRLSYDNPWLDVIPVVERDDTGNGGAEIGTLSDVVTRYGVVGRPRRHGVRVARDDPLDRGADAGGGHPAGPDQLRPVHPRLSGACRVLPARVISAARHPTVRPRRWPTPGRGRRVIRCR